MKLVSERREKYCESGGPTVLSSGEIFWPIVLSFQLVSSVASLHVNIEEEVYIEQALGFFCLKGIRPSFETVYISTWS